MKGNYFLILAIATVASLRAAQASGQGAKALIDYSVKVSHPVIMLTGYWSPTNEMLRPWTQAPSAQLSKGWEGANWEGRGYDVISFFPEHGSADFQVEYSKTSEDFGRIVPAIQPIALISFGLDASSRIGWQVEANAIDYWRLSGSGRYTTLPADEIVLAVNRAFPNLAAVDKEGDAGDFLCGFLFRLGANYRSHHSSPSDRAYMAAQGFIHVGPRVSLAQGKILTELTLREVIRDLDKKRRIHTR